jgi:hypothetical protein
MCVIRNSEAQTALFLKKGAFNTNITRGCSVDLGLVWVRRSKKFLPLLGIQGSSSKQLIEYFVINYFISILCELLETL